MGAAVFGGFGAGVADDPDDLAGLEVAGRYKPDPMASYSLRIQSTKIRASDGPLAARLERMRPSDTSPEVQKLMDEHYRQMTPAAKLEVLKGSWASARALAIAGLRIEFPGETEDELDLRWSKRRLGADLFERVRKFQLSLGQ